MLATGHTTVDKTLQHVYNSLKIPKDTQKKLAQKPYKIVRYGDILARKSRLRKHQNGLDQRTRNILLKVAEYMKATNYRASIGDDPDEFSMSSFADYVTSGVLIANVSLESILTTLQVSKQDIKTLEGEYGIYGCEDLVEKHGKLLEHSRSGASKLLDESTRRLLVKLAGFLEEAAFRLSKQSAPKHSHKRVNPVPQFSLDAFEKYLQRETVNYIVDRAPKPETFDVKWCRDLLMRWVQHLSEHYSKSQKEFIVYGPTQVGKSGAKASIAAFCKLLRIPCIIITKGRSCRDNLLVNLHKRFGVGVCDISKVTESDWNKRSARKYIDAVIVKGEAIVIPSESYNHIQMKKACDIVKWCRDDLEKKDKRKIQLVKKNRYRSAIMNFVLIADEADDYDRTSEGNTLLEVAWKDLKSLGPRLMVNVTATPYSLFENFERKKVAHEGVSIEPDSKEYYGLEELVPFKDGASGQSMFLKDNELKTESNISFNGCPIPSTCKKSMMLYKDALSNHKAGMLLVDISNHLVYCPNNIGEKMKLIQKYCATVLNRTIITVLSVGEGVFFRVEAGNDLRRAKSKNVSQVLEVLDKRFGHEIPIFLFGFGKLGRGVSTRSSGRVVTHLQVGLGSGHSLDNVIQALGRATGNVKTVLKKNLGANATVKVLINEEDWQASQIYVKYCKAKLAGSDDSGRLAKMLAELRSRRVGQRRNGKRKEKASTRFTLEYVSDEQEGVDNIEEQAAEASLHSNAEIEEERPTIDTVVTGCTIVPKRKALEDACREVTGDGGGAKRQRIEL
ncbi:MAG: hypothetical protein SGILL_008167 [Bacillariaceae sp.]